MTEPPGLRVLHLSDLHAGCRDPAGQRVVVERVLADITDQQAQKPIDLVIVSGDLTWKGKEDEFALAKELLLDPLGQLLQIDGARIVLVPGNHDVDRSLIDTYAETGWAVATQTREGSDALMEDSQALDRATARLSPWDEFARTFYDGSEVVSVSPFARAHRLDIHGTSIGVAALNSAWRASGDTDKGRLVIGERQLRASLQAIDGVDVALVAVHHPVDWLADFDLDAAKAEFAARGVMVLCGHEHMSDPMSVKTGGGQVVYSRAGSLFSSFDYPNGYSLIDVAPREGNSEFVLRTWWAERREFDEGSDRAHRGRVSLPWPGESRTQPSVSLRYSSVVATLSDTVKVRSVLADRLDGERRFDELIVPPRFLPSRYREATAAISLEPASRLERADPIAQLADQRVIVVAGEREAGVSTSLYWILKQHFDRDALRAPVFLTFDRRLDHAHLERAATKTLRAYGVEVSRAQLPPLFVAVDEVKPTESAAMKRLGSIIAERPGDYFALGCADEDYESLAAALADAGATHGTAFVAPFGRLELRELLERTSGDEGGTLLERVMTVVGKEHLPRSPFVLSALVAVLSQHADPSMLNESGVLGGYVDLLLSDDALVDLERLGMDKRRREHLLANLAVRLTESASGTLARLDAEQYLEQYFRAQGWLTASPGRVIDSLIRRRILASDDDAVGFRHPALFSFFQGAAYGDNSTFAERLREDPLSNASALRHAAGLRRDDTELLRFATELVEGRLAQIGGPKLEMYASDVAIATLDYELDAAPPVFTDRELDEHADRLDDLDAGRRQDSDPRAANLKNHGLGPAVVLLSQILRNTELSTELELKEKALRTATAGWIATGALALGETAKAAAAKEMVERLGWLLDNEKAADELLPLIDEFLRRLVVLMIAAGMSSEIASRHMEAVVRAAITDEDLMSEPVTAFLLTMLYASLGMRDWPEQLGAVYARHHGSDLIASGLRGWALNQYRTTPDQQEAKRLEAVLVDIYDPKGVGHGAGAIVSRGIAKGDALRKLRSQRESSQRAHSSMEPKLDPLDVEDAPSD
jgi:predicted MPP superfamily phosphohydrolase